MAKKPKNDAATTEGKVKVKAFTDHHRPLEAAGARIMFTSRPRNQSYNLEEWLTADRKYRLVKAYDDGRLAAFEEVASYADINEAAANLK